MIDANTKTLRRQFSSNKYFLLGVVLVVLLGFGLYAYNANRTSQPAKAGTTMITQNDLAENYGLRVQLLAVTAAGGLVDLRLQIVDAAKAQAFLSDTANIPALLVGDGVVLQTSLDGAEQDIQYEDGKSIFVMYPNSGNVLKSGDTVNILFGEFQLESIPAK